MRIEPKLEEIIYGDRGILKGIDVCLKAQCLVSAVSLIFSGIDSLAALTRGLDEVSTSRQVFKAWVDRYLLPDPNLSCNATDLYAARCGVLHTYSPESDLMKQGKAQPIIYQWHEGPDADATVPLPPDSIVVSVEDLYSAFKGAIKKFLRDAEINDEVKAKVRHHLASLLCYAPFPTLAINVAA